MNIHKHMVFLQNLNICINEKINKTLTKHFSQIQFTFFMIMTNKRNALENEIFNVKKYENNLKLLSISYKS